MNFRKWITTQGGADALAKRLKTTGHCVRIWIRGDGSPTASMIAKLIKLSKGKLSFIDIYKESTRNKGRGRNA